MIDTHALRRYAEGLIVLAERAYRLGRMDTTEEAGRILRSLPLSREYAVVGSYYGAICIGRAGQVTHARRVFERVAEEGSLGFRARSMVSLGGYCHKLGELQLALGFFVEAGRAAQHIRPFDPPVALGIHMATAALKGDAGDHKRSLEDLERIFPLARAVGGTSPPLFSDYLNSYAVELAGVGRLEEARNVSRIVLASPYASAYPEWRETFDEIAERGLRPSRSVVGFCETASAAPMPDNVVRLSEFARADEGASSEPRLGIQPGTVVDIEMWKTTRMPKESRTTPRLSKDDIKAMSRGEKRATIGELIYSESVSEQALEAIIAAAEELIAKDRAKN
ncbi:MAG TPA: hypothetical protein VJH03_21980 [Blastocatellia bacterium]|nr:hypothetical protein [Blastocatellia bacterium]